MTYFLPFLAVLLGFAVVSLFKLSSQWYIKLLLSFSGAFLLALTVFVLIPRLIHHHWCTAANCIRILFSRR